MSLSNLQAIGRLQPLPPDPAGMTKLLRAAQQNLADAQVPQISAGNRFDAAYKCIMQCAMLGLWAHGYRTSTSQPGHHQTAIQTLDQTLGVPTGDVIVLDRPAPPAQRERLRRRPDFRCQLASLFASRQQAAGAHAAVAAYPASGMGAGVSFCNIHYYLFNSV